MANVNVAVIQDAYDFTVNIHGEIEGLISGDQGYEPTGIQLNAVSTEIWLLGLAAWKAQQAPQN